MARQRQILTHCKHGHEFTAENTYVRPSGTRDCKICRRATLKRYYETHKKERVDIHRRWQQKNKEHLAEYQRNWHKNNKGYYSEYYRDYYAKHKDTIKHNRLLREQKQTP